MSAPSTIPVLFIDFDGVLNSEAWIRKRPSKLEWSDTMKISPEVYASDRLEWALRSIDPAAVIALNAIVSRTKARPIVSSSWRTMFGLDKLERLLRWHGFEHHLLGATPEQTAIRSACDLTAAQRVYRGDEIATWMTAMFGYAENLFSSSHPPHWPRTSYVILDDESDMGALSHRLYQTSFDVGLRDSDVDAVCALFDDPHGAARRLDLAAP